MFKPYPKYKASGVEWLGDVPEGWKTSPLKGVVSLLNGYPFDSSSFESSKGFPLIRIRDLNKSVAGTRYNGEFVPQAAITSKDVLIGMDGDFNVGRWRGEVPALLNQRMCCVRGKSEIVTRFLEYCIPVPLQLINDLTYFTTVKHLSSSQVERICIAMPSDEEIEGVVSFLDRETAKIDTLINRQETLIDLLKEKRQAVISHAVTQGLDPSVPMKASGVEWLGDVPAHWTICQIRRVLHKIEQGWSPECHNFPASDEQWGVLKAGCVNRGIFNEIDNKGLPDGLDPIAELQVKTGDVIVCRASGSREFVGSTALVTSCRHKLMISDKLFRMHFKKLVSPKFFVVLMNSRPLRLQIERAISGADGLANNLPQSALRNFYISVPSQEEQSSIVVYLDKVTIKIDTLITKAQKAIILQKEHRTALISAAVTGKIDVRKSIEERKAA